MPKQPATQSLRKTILDNFQVTSMRLNSGEYLINSATGSSKKRSTQINQLPVPSSQSNMQFIIFQAQRQKQLQREREKQLINKKYYNNDFSSKGFFINGVNYFAESLDVNEEAEVIQDCYSVKGDYFYLKKGEIIKIRAKVGQYLEVKYHKFVGYFPTKLFKLLNY